jgi:hypothetical protein
MSIIPRLSCVFFIIQLIEYNSINLRNVYKNMLKYDVINYSYIIEFVKILSIILALLIYISIFMIYFIIDIYDDIIYFYKKNFIKLRITSIIYSKYNTMNYHLHILTLKNLYFKLNENIIEYLDTNKKIYDIHYNGLYEIETINECNEVFYKYLNKYFILDISKIILGYNFMPLNI